MEQDSLPLGTRLWFAWVCLLRVFFDPAFAARAWHARLPPPEMSPARTFEPSGERPSLDQDEAKGRRVGAVQLLSLLQREGRLVDFLEQDIAAFSDGDVGAAARVVHEGCRRALRAHAKVLPVRSEEESSAIDVPAGFAPAEIKLTGDVRGAAPFRGTLRHRGWKLANLELPTPGPGFDPSIVAPAEVEL